MWFVLIASLLSACTKPMQVESPRSVVSIQTEDLRIEMTFEGKQGRTTSELVVAQNGTFTATLSSEGKPSKTTTGRLTPNEVADESGKLIAKIGDDNTVSVLDETEHRENGVLVKLETEWMDIGTFDAAGTFTAKLSGEKISVGADGKLAAPVFPGITVTVKAHTVEQKRIAIFLVLAMVDSGKTVMDSSGPVSVPAHPAMTN